MQERREKRAVCCSSADSLFRQIKRFKCPPLCFWHSQRKYYFKFRDIGTPAGVPISHFHGRGRRGRRHLQRRFLRKRGAAEKASANLQQAEPSQSSLRDASSPEGGAFCADRQISKAPPSGELDATSGSGLRGFARPGKQARVLAGNLTVMPKALPLRKDFPRSGGRCRAATKGGIWQSRQALTEGVRS